MKLALPAALVAVLAGCGAGAPGFGPELEIRLEAAAAEVRPGEVFELRVVRAWTEGLEPDPWNDAVLAPLEVSSAKVLRRVAGGRVTETRDFRALISALADVSLAPAIRARDPRTGTEHAARGPALSLRVRPELDPLAAGAAEWPDELLDLPQSAAQRLLFAALVAAALVLAFLLLRRRVPAAVAEIPLPARPSPRALARERLAELDPRAPASDAEIARFHERSAAILRDFLEAAGTLPALRRTTEETLADACFRAAYGESARVGVAEALGLCDLSKFARRRSSAEERARLLAALDAVLAEGA